MLTVVREMLDLFAEDPRSLDLRAVEAKDLEFLQCLVSVGVWIQCVHSQISLSENEGCTYFKAAILKANFEIV